MAIIAQRRGWRVEVAHQHVNRVLDIPDMRILTVVGCPALFLLLYLELCMEGKELHGQCGQLLDEHPRRVAVREGEERARHERCVVVGTTSSTNSCSTTATATIATVMRFAVPANSTLHTEGDSTQVLLQKQRERVLAQHVLGLLYQQLLRHQHLGVERVAYKPTHDRVQLGRKGDLLVRCNIMLRLLDLQCDWCWRLRLDCHWLRVQVLHKSTVMPCCCCRFGGCLSRRWLVRHPRLFAARRFGSILARRCHRRVRVAALVRQLAEAQRWWHRALSRGSSCLLLVLSSARRERGDSRRCQHRLYKLAIARRGVARGARRLSRVARVINKLLDFWGEHHGERLSLSQLPHAPARLRVVAHHHALANRHRGARICSLLDVHARRVHLVIKSEALAERDAHVGERRRGPAAFENHHLPVLRVEEDSSLRPY